MNFLSFQIVKVTKLIPPYITRFRVKKHEWQETPSDDWDIVAVKNLSAGGLVYNYNKNLVIDSLLDLKIEFIKSIPEIHCTGRAVRIEKTQPNSAFRIAAKLAEIDEQEREMINTTVEAISKKETKKRDRKTRENENCNDKKSSNSRNIVKKRIV